MAALKKQPKLDPKRLKMAQVFRGSGAESVGLAFHRRGQWCVSATGDGVVRLIDAVRGRSQKVVHAKKHGVSAVAFGHADRCVFVGDGSGPNVRYLSLYDNRYLRCYKGPSDVVDVAGSPADDQFLTSHSDGAVLLWDVTSKRAVAKLDGRSKWNKRRLRGTAPRAAFAPDALVFAAAANFEAGGGGVKLFDARNYGAGPFATFFVDGPALEKLAHKYDASTRLRALRGTFTDVLFSPDGEGLVLATDAGCAIVLDAFEGHATGVLAGPEPRAPTACGAAYAPGGGAVFLGGDDGCIRAWDPDAPVKRPAVLGGHAGPVRHVACSPAFDVVASACANAVLWLADAG